MAEFHHRQHCKYEIIIIGPYHAKTCLGAFADSDGPDQTAHPHSLIKEFTPLTESLYNTNCMNGEQRPV